jgi:hypothetical protein
MALDPEKKTVEADGQTVQQQDVPSSEDSEMWFVRILSAAVTAVVFSGLAFYFLRAMPFTQRFVDKYPWQVFLGMMVMIGVVALAPGVRDWYRNAPTVARAGFGVVVVLVTLVLLFLGFREMTAQGQILALRIFFLLIVCLLPAVLFFLFIATRKYSVLNEFLTNIDRLGLRGPRKLSLSPQVEETENQRLTRIDSYLRKFEAVFGPLREEERKQALMGPTDTTRSVRGTAAVVSVFTSETAVPVFMATILIALVWLIVLPPWLADSPKVSVAANSSHKENQAPIKAPATENPGPADGEQAEQGSAGKETPPGMPESSAKESSSTEKEQQGGATIAPTKESEPWREAFLPKLNPVNCAFLGAYFFSLQMLFRRYIRKDIRPSAFVAVMLRIILAMILIWIVEQAMILKEGGAIENQRGLNALGFFIGFFPRVGWQVLEGVVKRVLPTAILPTLQTEFPISDLDGLTVWHEARLEEEDVENVPNMATADILELMLSTRFPPERLVDWIDQAILYTHLGPEPGATPQTSRRYRLRAHGIRTASALAEVYRRSSEEDRRDKTNFEAILNSGGRSEVRSLVDAIETNPNLHIIRTWRCLKAPTGST